MKGNDFGMEIALYRHKYIKNKNFYNYLKMASIKEFLAWLILLLFWFYLCQHRNYHIFARIENIGKMCKRPVTWSDFRILLQTLLTGYLVTQLWQRQTVARRSAQLSPMSGVFFLKLHRVSCAFLLAKESSQNGSFC